MQVTSVGWTVAGWSNLSLEKPMVELLDAVSCAEFLEEQDELTQFFNDPVLIFD